MRFIKNLLNLFFIIPYINFISGQVLNILLKIGHLLLQYPQVLFNSNNTVGDSTFMLFNCYTSIINLLNYPTLQE